MNGSGATGAFLLIVVPAAAALEFLAPERRTAIFVASAIAIVPLAAYIGRATDELSSRLGAGLGGCSTPRSATPPS